MKNQLTSRLWDCINQSNDYSFKNNPLPVFYILYSCYCRVDVDIFDLDSSYNKDIFNQSNDPLKDFYNSLESKTKESIEKHNALFREFFSIIEEYYSIYVPSPGKKGYDDFVYSYKDLVEFFVDKYLSVNEIIRPEDTDGYNSIIASIFASMNGENRNIYEYKSVCASLVKERNGYCIDDYYGFIEDETLSTIAKIQVHANHFSFDSIIDWHNYDASNWSFYCNSRFNPDLAKEALDAYLPYKDDGGYGNNAVFTLPIEFCYSEEYEEYLERLVKDRFLSFIIILPAGSFVGYDREAVIIGLCDPQYNSVTNRGQDPSYFVFIDGRKMLKAGKLDYNRIKDTIWEFWRTTPRDYQRTPAAFCVPYDETSIVYATHCLLPAFWNNYLDWLEHEDKYEEHQLRELIKCAPIPGHSEEEYGAVLSENQFHDLIKCDEFLIQGNIELARIPEDYLKYEGKSLVLEYNEERVRFCIVDSDGSFYTSSKNIVFHPSDSFNGNWEYLCRSILSNDYMIGVDCKLLYSMSTIDRFSLEVLPNFWGFKKRDDILALYDIDGNTKDETELCSILNDKTSSHYLVLKHIQEDRPIRFISNDVQDQEAYIQRIKDDYANALAQEERDRNSQNMINATSDIAHILSLNFHDIRGCANALKGISVEADENVDCIIANLDYIKHILSSMGTDFESYHCHFKPTGINDFINRHIDSLRLLSRYNFRIEVSSSVSNDIEIEIDEELFCIMLNAILENARRHGFEKKENPNNFVKIHTKLSEDKTSMILSVCNNGKPLPDGFSLQDYVTKGSSVGNTGNTGLGGYHIYQIVNRHRGKLSIESDSQGHTVVGVTIPTRQAHSKV